MAKKAGSTTPTARLKPRVATSAPERSRAARRCPAGTRPRRHARPPASATSATTSTAVSASGRPSGPRPTRTRRRTRHQRPHHDQHARRRTPARPPARPRRIGAAARTRRPPAPPRPTRSRRPAAAHDRARVPRRRGDQARVGQDAGQHRKRGHRHRHAHEERGLPQRRARGHQPWIEPGRRAARRATTGTTKPASATPAVDRTWARARSKSSSAPTRNM